jgi:hypothetical protein
MTRLHKIIRGVKDTHITARPNAPDGFFWFKADRGDPSCWQLAEDRKGGAAIYEVGLRKDARFNRAGWADVRLAVYLFSFRIHDEVDSESILAREYTGYDQPLEQCAINNLVGGVYQDKVNDAAERMFEAAEYWAAETEDVVVV